jgi:shikimate dehydrogenase
MRRISGTTAVCGIVLHPAGHTRSPAMHNAAFEALDIDAVYSAFDVPPELLGEAIRGVRAMGLRQLAVSLPHKLAVMEHLDEVDEIARKIGAVNTVTRVEDRLVGSNTDWLGAVRALERDTELGGRRAVVLGAGGAARAVVFGLLERGAEVHILNRTRSKAEQLASDMHAAGAGELAELSKIAADVVVNTTSVGLKEDRSPVDSAAIPRNCLVMDAVYEPEDTRLLRDARERGARTQPGKWMLIYQAAEQLELWTGQSAPIEVMERAFDAAGS